MRARAGEGQLHGNAVHLEREALQLPDEQIVQLRLVSIQQQELLLAKDRAAAVVDGADGVAGQVPREVGGRLVPARRGRGEVLHPVDRAEHGHGVPVGIRQVVAERAQGDGRHHAAGDELPPLGGLRLGQPRAEERNLVHQHVLRTPPRDEDIGRGPRLVRAQQLLQAAPQQAPLVREGFA